MLARYEEEKPFELTIKSHGNEYSAKIEWDCDVTGVLEALYGLLVAATWHPQSIINGMKEFVEERKDILGEDDTDMEDD